MRTSPLPLLALFAAAALRAQTPGPSPRLASGWDTPDPWTYSAAAYWNMPREGASYASGIFSADHGQLHLEARANYEAMHSQSAFIGWTFSGGEKLRVSATPIIGAVAGEAHGPIAGLEASVAAGKLDYYLEAEYLPAHAGRSGYLYAWSELAYRPVEWIRLGIVMQRTRIYGGDRDIRPGGLVQLTVRNCTAGVYWFNPGAEAQVVMLSLAFRF
ncbi:hypothetical protein [Cupriavidus necator]|uniref:Uncharacterized protein n=1 Tax=Cupriavidus pinatubonensis (strain JMP 134 / LMG 1197) TaxID=264198 RepID=Q46S30_CUPPJ|nr:hypothetical protein [Cupriavidus necator]